MFNILAFTVKPGESADTRYRILQYRPLAGKDSLRIDHRSLMGPRYFHWQIQNVRPILRLLLYPYLVLVRLWQILFLAPTYDAVWVLRELAPLGPPFLERILLRRCKRVIFDIDDALHIPDPDGSRFIPRILRDFSKFARMAPRFSAIVCGNQFLADFYRAYSSKVHIIPTVVDPDTYAGVIPIPSEIVRIGWIGTPLNKHHLQTLYPALSALAHERSFELIVVGLNDTLEWDLPNIRYIEWNLLDELDFFRHFDIGIMPLQDSPFARGKCAFKLIQYMATGLPVVASAVGANCDVVQSGQNGFLVTTPDEWQSALRRLIDEPDLRRRMGENGRALIRRSYSVGVAWSSYIEILTASIRQNPVLRSLILLFLSLGMTCQLQAEPHQMRLGVDADNWSGQIQNPAFEAGLRRLNLGFISWHLQPEEEISPARINQIVQFCRKNHWSYLFNNEVVNYRREDGQFRHRDTSFRYDIAEQTLQQLKDDPLFLGVIYDEADLMQAMNGVVFGKGGPIEPYFVDTRQMTADQAFLAVSAKVAQLTRRYQSYRKRLIFEMVFPDNPFPFARGGALLAPKLLKENFNDLMYDVYRGAALEYHSKELWACVDLWFLDKFPFAGKTQPPGHTPDQLLETLKYAASSGFDYAYIEQYKGLLDDNFALTAFGEKVVEFNRWHENQKDGDWRTAPIDIYVKRFPDGYWGQKYSPFIPDHPYGSWLPNPYRSQDEAWLRKLSELSHGTIPPDADNWNASKSPDFSNRPYQTLAGLPPMVVFDQFCHIPSGTKATILDFTSNHP